MKLYQRHIIEGKCDFYSAWQYWICILYALLWNGLARSVSGLSINVGGTRADLQHGPEWSFTLALKNHLSKALCFGFTMTFTKRPLLTLHFLASQTWTDSTQFETSWVSSFQQSITKLYICILAKLSRLLTFVIGRSNFFQSQLTEINRSNTTCQEVDQKEKISSLAMGLKQLHSVFTILSQF